MGTVLTVLVVLVYIVASFIYVMILLSVLAAFVASPVLIVVGVVRLIAGRVRRPAPQPAIAAAPVRVSRLERERAVARLGSHWEAERLTADELEDRVGIALGARWGHELELVLSDLPAPPAERYAGWLRAAAAYNAGWGAVTVLAPGLVAGFAGMRGNLVAIGLAGKTLGILGFLWALAAGALPLRFGLVTLTNDALWLPAFAGYLRAAARERGGWPVLLSGS